MIGPCCESCIYYNRNLIGKSGDCTDPDKAIYARNGNRVNMSPTVLPDYTCYNHETEQDTDTPPE